MTPIRTTAIRTTIGVFALVLVFLSTCALISPPGAIWRFFTEGGPVDWLSSVFLVTASVLAASVWLAARREGERGVWFWLAGSLGLAALALDERFQFHELLFGDSLAERAAVPAGFRNWNDLVVIAYGVVGLLVLAISFRILLSNRRFSLLLLAGFGFYGMHTVVDAVVEHSTLKAVVEESFKVLAVATVMLAFLQAAFSRPPQSVSIGRIAAVIGVASLAVATVFRGSVLDWGPPSNWVASACIACAGLLLAFAAPWRGRAVFVAVLAWLAWEESVVACAEAFRFGRLRGVLTSVPGMWGEPFVPATDLRALIGALFCVALARVADRSHRAPLRVAAVLLVVGFGTSGLVSVAGWAVLPAVAFSIFRANGSSRV